MPISSDVFLSYPHVEKEAVHELAAALTAEGLTVWIDKSGVAAFEHIHDRVASGIAGSRAVLAWYSKHYAASRPCQWELSAAWLCEDGERILVVNPEEKDQHIQPRLLVRRSYVGAEDLKDLPALARQVKSRVAGFATAIGDSTSFTQPLHYGRQLAGSNRFVGRQEQFWELHEALLESRATMLTGAARSVAQLRGFGGVGKSALAEEYALRFGAAYPGGIFWLKAYGNDDGQRATQPNDRDDERLRQLSDFASRLHIPTEGRSPGEIQSALANVLAADYASGRRSLWIVDDVPSGLTAEALSQWLSPHACVPTLITTRDRSHSSLGKLFDIDVLSQDEALKLLESHRAVEDSERQAALELLDALGRHALAVEITGSFLGEQQSISFEDFLRELRDPDEDVLEQAAELADTLPLDHSPSIVATLKSTISQLGEPARDLLCLASCLAAAPIPKELIEAVFARLGTSGSASFRRMKAAKEAERFALSRRESAPPDALSVHTLVTRTARRHPDSQERLERIQAAAAASLTDMLRGMSSLGAILRQSLLITHARSMSAPLTSADEAMLLVLVAYTDLSRGDLEMGERLANRALDYCRAELGEGSVEACCARSIVAIALLTRGDSGGAREILEAVAPVIERSLPPGDILRVGAQLGLAYAAAGQGDLTTARRLAEAELSVCADAKGADHPLILAVKTVLGQILQMQGDIAGAARLHQEVSEVRGRIADSSNVDRLTDEILAAHAKIGTGEIESVAPIIESAAAVFEKEFGEDNVLTLRAKLLLLLLLASRQDNSGVKQLAGQIIPRFEQMFGPNNPATLQARCTQALTLLCVNDNSTGLSLIKSIIPAMEAVYGPDHAEVLAAKVGLAQALNANGDQEGARRILYDLIPTLDARLGPASAVTMNAKECLAHCLFDENDYAGACKAWEEIVALREVLLGSDHPQVLNNKLMIAHLLRLLRQYERCCELLNQVIPLAESRLGPEHNVTRSFKECLTSCQRAAHSLETHDG